MNLRILCLSALICTPVAFAADMDEDAEAVWSVIASSWEDEVAENEKWPAEYVHDDVVAWDASWPVPRGKQSLIEWNRIDDETNAVLKHELFPMHIVVAGDTATAHYTAVTLSETDKGEREREVLGLVETLVRQDGEWKFLSLTSFLISDDD